MAGGLDEFARIDRFFKPLSRGFTGALGLEDDAGLIAAPAGEALAVTTDAMVEGVHYPAGEDPARLARKLLRVNLSDLAAMGARPLAYTLTTALPAGVTEDWLAAFAAGLEEDQGRYGIHLLGGDSVSTPGPAMLSVTAFGSVREARALRRAGALVGDDVFVSGSVGDAALGLLAVRGELDGLAAPARAALAGRYRLPEPRGALGPRLIGLAHAAVDLSDGLVGDLGHICAASGVAARIEAARVPLSDAGRAAVAADPALLPVALAGGDDYELAFTAPPSAADALGALAADLDLPLTRIGTIGAGGGVTVVDSDGQTLTLPVGWRHF